VLSPLFRSDGEGFLSRAISLAYPIGDVVVGTIVLVMLARAPARRRHQRDPLPLLDGGLVAWASRTAGSCT
jgi:hypothetical protein